MTPTIDEIQTLEEFTMADLAAANIPAGLVAAIATAQNELIANEQERTQSSLRLATEQTNAANRIRGLEMALAALSRPRDDPDDVYSTGAGPLPPSSRTYADLVGDYLLTDRTSAELEHSIVQVVSKAERMRLSPSDKGKLYATFVKRSPSKFKATSSIVGLEEISTIENITSFAQLRLELQKHITSVSVHPVFLILQFTDDGTLIDPDTPEGTPINLLSASSLPSLSLIQKSMQFYHRRGSTFNRENLVWSLEAVRNSCDKDLQVILDAKMLKYPYAERFGPLYYYELVQQMTDVDSKAVRGITQELTSLKLIDQEGQSIAKIASIIRSTIIWLEMVKMVPPDIDAIVLDILETCTVPDFQLFLKTLATNAALNGIKLSYVTLLDKAETHYRTLIVSKKWDAVGHQGSTFQAQAQRLPAARGSTDHTRPRTNMPSWSRIPPSETEPHERTFESQIFKWCSVCQRWFFGHRAHLTAEHQAGHPAARGRRSNLPTMPATPTPAVHFASASPTDADSTCTSSTSSLSRPAPIAITHPSPHTSSEGALYKPIERHLFGASGFHDLRSNRYHFLHTIFQHLFSATSLGRTLRRTIYAFIISRIFILIRSLFLLPSVLLQLYFPSRRVVPIVARPVIPHTRPLPPPPLPSPPSVFDFTFRLASDCDFLPLALNAHVTRADFDPDFVATLLSRAPDDDVVDIILDTGCTFSITPDRRDFVSYQEGSVGNVQTVNGPTAMAGYGLVRWTLISEDGTQMHLLVPCHHIPASKVRLLSPQDYCQYRGFDRSKDQFGGNSSYFWMNAAHDQSRFQCPIDPRSNLPVALAKTPCNPGGCDPQTDLPLPPSSCSSCHRHGSANLSVTDETNQNITAAQKDLLLWHFRLGHLGFAHLQQLMRPRTVEDLRSTSKFKSEKPVIVDPCIVPKNPSTRTCKLPLCAACQIARAKRRPTEVATTTVHKESLLKVQDLVPGSRVSVDQYESAVRGRLANTKGKESFGHKYAGGTIFCDHASGYIQCFHQVSLRAADTVLSKRGFERSAKLCGVQVQTYHGDNGVFKSKEFQESLTKSDKSEQKLQFSGVGAHHQNGVAERAIRTVTEKARSMMQHAFLHWPDEFEVQLWPFALDYACWLHNHTPSHTHGWAPLELFCGTQVDCQHLQRARVWGCPSYVLSPTLQDGKKIPKWAPRARRGQFLGFSTNHSSMIGVLRNIQTGSVTPQFHVVFDELFSTVNSLEDDDPMWIELFTSERDYYGPDEEEEDSNDSTSLPELDPSWLPIAELPTNFQRGKNDASTIVTSSPQSPVHGNDDNGEFEGANENPDEEPPPLISRTVNDSDGDDDPPLPQDIRPERTRRPNKRVFGDEWANFTVQLTPTSRTMLGHIIPNLSHDDLFLHSLDWDAPFSGDYEPVHRLNLLHTDPFSDEVDWIHPFTLAAKASSSDAPTLREIQRLSPAEIELWYEAMDVELQALRDKDTMFEIDRSDVPHGKQIVKSTWAFKRKRRPNGEIHKLKARFVVRGDLQILDEHEGTFSPVVDWSTVCLLFILTVAQGLKSTTIDFNAAFVQSDLPEPIYLELPPGYGVPNEDKVYKVGKSLYGDVRAARLWYNHLSAALVSKLGFIRSSIDSCLYLRDGLVFVFYVDDGIIISADDSAIQRFIEELRECKFDLGIEADYAGYLGVDIIVQPDGTLLMSQTGLIERILVDFGLTDSASTKITPAAEILGPFKASPPFEDTFNYRSVLGKILYVSSNTRCEITLSNHQCARFSIDPRTPHGVALKRIGRYLLGTRDKGMIIRPTKDLTLDCYADADFAGLFSSSSDPDDPKSVKSRSGFVITLGKIPVSWGSKLQSETALSTMEAEYISLSQSLRVLLPLRVVLNEVSTFLHLKQDPHSSIRSTIFEDNQACLSLATSNPPKMTPRSKSIAVKYHWFREHLEPGIVEIQAIASADQLADIFTKPLSPVVFINLRKQLLGW